jgi:hypothetical protein
VRFIDVRRNAATEKRAYRAARTAVVEVGRIRGIPHFIPDLVQFLDRVGTGSIDIVATGSGSPVMLFRTFWNDGNGGTAGALIDAVAESAALNQGDAADLIAPPTAGGYR